MKRGERRRVTDGACRVSHVMGTSQYVVVVSTSRFVKHETGVNDLRMISMVVQAGRIGEGRICYGVWYI